MPRVLPQISWQGEAQAALRAHWHKHQPALLHSLPATWKCCSNDLAAASTLALCPRTECKGGGLQSPGAKGSAMHSPASLW